MNHFGSRAVATLLIVLVMASCGEETTNPYYLTADVRGDQSLERTWVEPDFEKIATLSQGDGYTFFDPRALGIEEDGHVYVFDFGDNTVKRFTRHGVYRATYGNGVGRAPDQMMGMRDGGIWRDSLVYVVDGRQRKVLFFNRETGAFVRTESYEVPIARLAYADDSTKYVEAASRTSDFLFMTTPRRQTSVSRIFSRDIPSIALDGRLHSSHGRAVFVPFYFPVILTYAPGDTTGIAYPTPDYGDAPIPAPQAESQGRTRVVRAPSNPVNGVSEMHGGVLAVQHPNTSEDSTAFDLYDAEEGSYLHTVRFPIDREIAKYGAGIVASIQDTTVNIYRVEDSVK